MVGVLELYILGVLELYILGAVLILALLCCATESADEPGYLLIIVVAVLWPLFLVVVALTAWGWMASRNRNYKTLNQ